MQFLLFGSTKTRTYSKKIWMFLKMKWWIRQKAISQFTYSERLMEVIQYFQVPFLISSISISCQNNWFAFQSLIRRKMDFWLRFNLMRSLLTWNPWEHKSQSSIKRKLLYKRPILLVRQQGKIYVMSSLSLVKQESASTNCA